MATIIEQNLLSILTGIIIGSIGIIIQRTRSFNSIAGYNTMSSEKRKKVNIEQVAIALRNALILLGVNWIIIPIISDLSGLGKIKVLFIIVLHFIILIYLIFTINTRDKYKN
jgi:hypothetical protein